MGNLKHHLLLFRPIQKEVIRSLLLYSVLENSLGAKPLFVAKETNFCILIFIQPKAGLTMSHPLNHRHVNLRIDSCLDVSAWDSCPQQTYLILLHGHLAAYTPTHMVAWQCAYLLVGHTVPLGYRCQANRLSWVTSITAHTIAYEGNLPLVTRCHNRIMYLFALIHISCTQNIPKRRQEKKTNFRGNIWLSKQ